MAKKMIDLNQPQSVLQVTGWEMEQMYESLGAKKKKLQELGYSRTTFYTKFNLGYEGKKPLKAIEYYGIIKFIELHLGKMMLKDMGYRLAEIRGSNEYEFALKEHTRPVYRVKS